MRPGTLGRTGNGAEVAYVGNTVEEDNERRLILGDPLQNIRKLHIGDGCHLRHDTLMVAAHEAVEFLDGHLLPAQPVPHAEVLQLLHQRSLGPLADVEPLDLLPGLDGLGHGTNPEYKVILHNSAFFVVSVRQVRGSGPDQAFSVISSS